MSGYDFSQLYHANIIAFSPGSTFTATAHGRRVIIRSTDSLSIVRTFQCLPSTPGPTTATAAVKDASIIDHLSWSADSLYIIASSSRTSTAWVFGLTEQGSGEGGEIARLSGDGVDGLAKVEWGRNGREILAWSEHTPRITVYDLSDNSASYVQNVKNTSPTWSPDSRYLAVAERHSSKDYVGVYDATNNYSLLRVSPGSSRG